MHVLHKKVYSLCVYYLLCSEVLYFRNSGLKTQRWKQRPPCPLKKNRNCTSLSFHITTEETASGHGRGWPCLHLESLRATRKLEVQSISGENGPVCWGACGLSHGNRDNHHSSKSPAFCPKNSASFTHIWNSMALVSSKVLEIVLSRKEIGLLSSHRWWRVLSIVSLKTKQNKKIKVTTTKILATFQ